MKTKRIVAICIAILAISLGIKAIPDKETPTTNIQEKYVKEKYVVEEKPSEPTTSQGLEVVDPEDTPYPKAELEEIFR